MNKKILFLVLFSILALPFLASAQVTIGSMAEAIAGQVVFVGQMIVIIMWIVTGVLYLTCIGDPGKLKTANIALMASIAGTIVIILAVGAQSFVARSFHI